MNKPRIQSKRRWQITFRRLKDTSRNTVEGSGAPARLNLQEVADRTQSPSRFEMSPWTQSRARRIFDIAIVLAFLAVLLPVLALIAFALLASSGAPVIFRQRRAGRHGVPFQIYKFRTMRHASMGNRGSISAESADRITPLGAFLRKTKLDELPQFLNVLAGDMSLVGPRPKVPEQQLEPLPCRPGLTGPATLQFAREESFLLQVPQDSLAEFYNSTVLPAKFRLDADYLRRATLGSDLRILLDTIMCRWARNPMDIEFAERERGSRLASSEAASLSQ
jgi:lipopolysaccharide/colanic/teichoic acid biosynthesis glycosyltransferase